MMIEYIIPKCSKCMEMVEREKENYLRERKPWGIKIEHTIYCPDCEAKYLEIIKGTKDKQFSLYKFNEGEESWEEGLDQKPQKLKTDPRLQDSSSF